MFPDLIDLGFLHIRTYGACMAAGFLVCWWLVERLSGRKDLSNLLMYLMVAGVVGSRAAYVIEHWQAEFAADPLRVIRVDQGGLMFYGGLILALVVFFAWCIVKRERTLALADLLAVVVPLGHAFGRIGCFFYGCCYGRDSDAWCAVVGLLMLARSRAKRGGWGAGLVTGLYLVGYAAIRFGIEYLRGDPRAAVGPLSISQAISVGMALLGAVIIAVARMRGRAAAEGAAR